MVAKQKSVKVKAKDLKARGFRLRSNGPAYLVVKNSNLLYWLNNFDWSNFKDDGEECIQMFKEVIRPNVWDSIYGVNCNGTFTRVKLDKNVTPCDIETMVVEAFNDDQEKLVIAEELEKAKASKLAATKMIEEVKAAKVKAKELEKEKRKKKPYVSW